MKESTYRLILLMVLVFIVIAAGLGTKYRSEKEDGGYKITDRETGGRHEKPDQPEQAVRLNKDRIGNLRNHSEDNIGFQDTELELTFSGYEEHPERFSWLSKEEYGQFQEQLKSYLQKKGLESVSQVNLHPDSIQTINEFERYLYLDVDYRTEASEVLAVKVTCDTYKGFMRFAFEIQYGD